MFVFKKWFTVPVKTISIFTARRIGHVTRVHGAVYMLLPGVCLSVCLTQSRCSIKTIERIELVLGTEATLGLSIGLGLLCSARIPVFIKNKVTFLWTLNFANFSAFLLLPLYRRVL